MNYLCMAFEKQRNYKDDSVAQQVEHIPFKDGVLGSSPSWVTKSRNELIIYCGFSFCNLTSQPLYPLDFSDLSGSSFNLKKKQLPAIKREADTKNRNIET